MGKNFLSLIIVVLISIVAGLALLHKGFPPTHDGEYHVIRFYLFNESISDGNLYPRWAAHLNNNFGVPLFTFVYPFPNYVATLFHLFNISFIDSLKIEMFIAIIAGGVFFYLWSREFWGRLGGVVSSVFYTFSPYHFVDIYIRGSVGEVWALAFFPAFLWAYTRFVKSKKRIFLMYSSLCLALIIFSHNILALMFFFFALSYVSLLICREQNKKYLILNTLYLIILGLGLSAIFWLPAIYETRYVTGLQIFDVFAHFPDLYQLIIPSWGSGFSGGSLQNELSFQIGIPNLVAVSLSLFLTLSRHSGLSRIRFWSPPRFALSPQNESKVNIIIFFLVWFILVFFLMLKVSQPIWETVPLMGYFQFPWRLLSLEIIFASFLAGSIFSLRLFSVRKTLAISLIFFAFILGIGYAKPAYYHYRNDNYYIKRSNFIDGTNSPGNVFNTVFLKTIPHKEKERAKFLKGEGKIVMGKKQSNRYIFKINSSKNSEILMNLAYYPGWEVYVNDKRVEVKPTENGRFTFSLPHGKNKVEVIFKDTFVRKLAEFVSFVSLVFLFTLFIKKRSVTINK